MTIALGRKRRIRALAGGNFNPPTLTLPSGCLPLKSVTASTMNLGAAGAGLTSSALLGCLSDRLCCRKLGFRRRFHHSKNWSLALRSASGDLASPRYAPSRPFAQLCGM